MIICLSDRLLPPPSARPPADQNHFTLLHPTVPDTMIMIPQVRLQRKHKKPASDCIVRGQTG